MVKQAVMLLGATGALNASQPTEPPPSRASRVRVEHSSHIRASRVAVWGLLRGLCADEADWAGASNVLAPLQVSIAIFFKRLPSSNAAPARHTLCAAQLDLTSCALLVASCLCFGNRTPAELIRMGF